MRTLEERNALSRKRFAAKPELYRAIKRASQSRNKEKKNEKSAEWRKANHDKTYAEYTFRYAIRAGWIERPGPNLHFHHTDYSRIYYGCWVSPADHRKIHAGLIQCPECVDYAPAVEAARKAAIARRNRNAGIAACKVRWGIKEPL